MNPGTSEEPAEAILFDYGGVLAEEGFREGLMALARRFGLDPVQVYQEGSTAVYDSGYVLNRGSEADFWAMMSARTGLPPYDTSFTREILQRFVLRPGMLRVAGGLRAGGLLTAILSDQTDWLDLLNERDRFFRNFDRVFNSFHLGKGKRDPSVFRRRDGGPGCRAGTNPFHRRLTRQRGKGAGAGASSHPVHRGRRFRPETAGLHRAGPPPVGLAEGFGKRPMRA